MTSDWRKQNKKKKYHLQSAYYEWKCTNMKNAENPNKKYIAVHEFKWNKKHHDK